MSDKPSFNRRDFLKMGGYGMLGAAGMYGAGAVIRKAGEALDKNVREINSDLDPEYEAVVVSAEENLSRRVKEKFSLPFVNSAFAIECRGATLSNFVLAPKSDDSQVLAIYTDLGDGNPVELVFNPQRSTPNMEWHRRDINEQHDPVLSYAFTSENKGEEVTIFYRPPVEMATKIGYQEKEKSFHFSSLQLPEPVRQQLGLD